MPEADGVPQTLGGPEPRCRPEIGLGPRLCATVSLQLWALYSLVVGVAELLMTRAMDASPLLTDETGAALAQQAIARMCVVLLLAVLLLLRGHRITRLLLPEGSGKRRRGLLPVATGLVVIGIIVTAYGLRRLLPPLLFPLPDTPYVRTVFAGSGGGWMVSPAMGFTLLLGLAATWTPRFLARRPWKDPAESGPEGNGPWLATAALPGLGLGLLVLATLMVADAALTPFVDPQGMGGNILGLRPGYGSAWMSRVGPAVLPAALGLVLLGCPKTVARLLHRPAQAQRTPTTVRADAVLAYALGFLGVLLATRAARRLFNALDTSQGASSQVRVTAAWTAVAYAILASCVLLQSRSLGRRLRDGVGPSRRLPWPRIDGPTLRRLLGLGLGLWLTADALLSWTHLLATRSWPLHPAPAHMLVLRAVEAVAGLFILAAHRGARRHPSARIAFEVAAVVLLSALLPALTSLLLRVHADGTWMGFTPDGWLFLRQGSGLVVGFAFVAGYLAWARRIPGLDAG